MSPRDMTPPPERSPEELDALAEITEDDLLHAEETARRLATPKMQQLLNATPENPTGDAEAETRRQDQRRTKP